MTTDTLGLALLEAPAAVRGWLPLQALLVDRIKRRALQQLHASRAGEVLILRVYFAGETITELELHREFTRCAPDWLQRQLARHLDEERQHAAAFADALRQRGAPPQAQAPDLLSRWKIAQWRRIGYRYSARLTHGDTAAAFAIALCAEQMAERVLARHCSLLAAGHPLLPLLEGVLADERRHVRLCGQTLLRLVPPAQYPLMAAMLAEVRGIDRAFGVSSALVMLAAGIWLRMLERCAWKR